jgi:cardiolipin synthase
VEAGGQVFFFPEMNHSKLMIVDESFLLVGSANFDLRSLLYNYELGVFAYSPSEIEQACALMQKFFDQSSRDNPPPGFVREMLEGVGRIFGPLL